MDKASALTNLITKVPKEVRAKIAKYFNEPDKSTDILELAVLINGEVNIVKHKVEALGGNFIDLGFNFGIVAIVGMGLEDVLSISEIRYFELPKPMYSSFEPANKASCITNVWETYKVTGKGVLVGFIDSGIDYMHPAFRNVDGTTRIKYIYDIQGNKVFTEEDINKAIKSPNPFSVVNQVDSSGHGTHVAGIACGGGRIGKQYYGVAYESSIIMVKMTRTGRSDFAQSTQLMKGIKFLIGKSKELNMPLSINLSFSTNDGAHDGKSLLELYIETVTELERLSFSIAAGNEGDSGHHVGGIIKAKQSINFNIGGDERIIVLQLFKNFLNEISIDIKDPGGRTTGIIKLNRAYLSGTIGFDEYYIYNSGPQPFNIGGETVFILVPLQDTLTSGIWTITIYSNNEIKNQEYNIWLPISEGLNSSTKFLSPDPYNTLGIPGTVGNVITVGSYNSLRGNISSFSGRGAKTFKNVKPDIVAPGENIESASPNNSFSTLSGTSMATPVVAGATALLMEWGIVNGKDLYMYGDRVKYFLLKGAERDREDISYPDPSWGYGTLCLSNSFEAWINEGLLSRKDNNLIIDRGNSDKVCSKGFLKGDYESIIILYEGDIEGALKPLDYACAIILDQNYAVLIVQSNRKNEVLKNTPEIIYSDRGSLYTLNAISPLDAANIEKFHDDPFLTLRGTGVVIGMVDTGIDYLNKQFLYEDDTSRIISLWDQTIEEGPSPKGIGIGTEYTREQINQAILAHKEKKNPYEIVKSKDEIGHGTKMAGIVGARDGSMGAAPDCEFAIVKLNQVEQSFLDILGIRRGDIPIFDGCEIVLAVYYLFTLAKRLRKPMVIFIPLGSNFGAHDGSALLERYIDDVSKSRGIVVVTGTGNEGDSNTHTEGKIEKTGDVQTVEVKVDDKEENLLISIWCEKPDKVAVGLVSPSGESIDRVAPKFQTLDKFKLIFEGSTVSIKYLLPEELTGDENITILINNIRGGIWQIKLYGDYIVGGEYNIWLAQRELLRKETRFLKSSPYTTMTIPGTAQRVIVTSAYDQNNNTILAYSGRGFTRGGEFKPDLTTGGVNVKTTIVGGGSTVVSGSSAASAVLAGAVALILQWGIIEKNDPDLYALKVKSYLIRGTRKREGDTYPNTQWGYGILDLDQVFKNLRGLDKKIRGDKVLIESYVEDRIFIRIPEELLEILERMNYDN